MSRDFCVFLVALCARAWYNIVGQRHMWRFSFRGGPGEMSWASNITCGRFMAVPIASEDMNGLRND